MKGIKLASVTQKKICAYIYIYILIKAFFIKRKKRTVFLHCLEDLSKVVPFEESLIQMVEP